MEGTRTLLKRSLASPVELGSDRRLLPLKFRIEMQHARMTGCDITRGKICMDHYFHVMVSVDLPHEVLVPI